MNHDQPSLVLRNYVTGFVGSLVLTLTSYAMVTSKSFSTTAIIVTVGALAILQFALQLVCFLHLGRGRERWQLYVFIFMLVVVTILIAGSYWIMNNLNYNMMQNPGQMNTYMHSQDAF